MERLTAEAEIRKVIFTRARAGDRRDKELALSCYHPDATEDHEGFQGPAREFVAQSQITKPELLPVMYHFVGNIHVEFVDKGAMVETYCIALAQINAEQPGDAMVAARYLDWFTFRDGRWAIQHRTMVIDHSRWDEPGKRYADALGLDTSRLVFGKPDRSDPSFTFAATHID